MAREIGRLNARRVSAETKPGRHADGNNLYLAISSNGGRRWVFLYSRYGKQVELGFGSARTVTLARARALAKAAHDVLAGGGDPRTVRKPAGVVTFGEAADALVESLAPSFRNAKHRAQWAMTLTEYAAPLRDKPVGAIGTEDVLAVLKPLWLTKPETAGRLRGRIERVLDAARARGLRSGDNPARWRGNLDHLLEKRTRLSRGHHAAMPFAAVPALLTRLQSRGDVVSTALEFTILTAARTGETIGATWAEIDLESRVWTVPAERMKAGRAHRVPLSDRAVAILEARKAGEPSDYVFPGARAGAPLSNMSMSMALRRSEGEGVTVHGFRSAFRDWAGDSTTFPREIAEAALAHVISDKTEAAYRRADALDKRRKLMDAWARYCTAASANVAVFPRRA